MNEYPIEVRTKPELDRAIKNEIEDIIVIGDLAEKIHQV